MLKFYYKWYKKLKCPIFIKINMHFLKESDKYNNLFIGVNLLFDQIKAQKLYSQIKKP